METNTSAYAIAMSDVMLEAAVVFSAIVLMTAGVMYLMMKWDDRKRRK
jgi:hypothetical protein